MRAKKNPPSKAFKAGLAMCKKVLGEDYVEKSFLYCGAPASLDAFHIAAAVLPEIEALEKAAKRKRR